MVSALAFGFAGFDTRWAFAGLFALLAGERGLELLLSARHARWARAHGGFEVPEASVYRAMVTLHVLFLLGPPLEVFLLRRPFLPWLALPALFAAALAMALRYWAIASLGPRWNTRVIVVPGMPAASGGPYRLLRHPNYLAVVIEVAALPLVHTAWLSALLFSAANALVLVRRVRGEEAALSRYSDYATQLGDRPRFLPGAPR